MTLRSCRICDGWHDLDHWPDACLQAAESKRAAFAAPHCISDSMEPTLHMADGRRYTSKAVFRAVTRAHGYTEVGTEQPKPHKPKRPERKDIHASVAKAFSQAGLGA